MLTPVPAIFLTLVRVSAARAAVAALAALVPLGAGAAPTAPSPDFEPETAEEPAPSQPADRDRLELIEITAPPGPPPDKATRSHYFYPYRKAMSPRLGAGYDSKEYADHERLLYVVGIQYMFPTRQLHTYEAGADVASNGTGFAHFSRRWVLSRTRFRPYYKVGGALNVVPSQGLTTILKLENYQARAAYGFESLIALPMSVRLEAEAALGPRSAAAFIHAGYSWGW